MADSPSLSVLQDLAMLVIGRVMLGWGVGFANQAVPLYLSEIAPPHVRGTLNIMFQMATTIGESSASGSSAPAGLCGCG